MSGCIALECIISTRDNCRRSRMQKHSQYICCSSSLDEKRSGMPELLAELYGCTGNAVHALCSGGAALVHRNNGAVLYFEMLDYLPSNLDFIIILTFGNDWYNYVVRPLSQPTCVAARQLFLRMQSLSRRQFAVLGGSSDTWGYKAWMQPQHLNQFDGNAEALCDICQNTGTCAITGADELQNLKLADVIGHVSADQESKRIIF